MFYDLEEYVDRIVSTHGSICFITYGDKNLRQSLLNRLESIVMNKKQYEFVQIDAFKYSAEDLHEKIVSNFDSTNNDKLIVAIVNADQLLPKGIGGKILNGCRERLTLFKATLIVISESSLRFFQIAAPDLMGLVGSFFVRAEQMAEPILEDDIL
jgi:hypothetical protein